MMIMHYNKSIYLTHKSKILDHVIMLNVIAIDFFQTTFQPTVNNRLLYF